MAESLGATKTGSKNVMVYEDPVITDTLFGSVVRNIFLVGFGILVVSRVAIAITSLVMWSKISDAVSSGRNGDPFGLLATQTTQQAFLLVDAIGTLVFSAGFVVAALVVSRMAEWTRVTMLSVAGFLLVGSNVAATVGLMSLMGAMAR